jgi:hypothetical protein
MSKKDESVRWVYNKGRVSGSFKKIIGFEAWFYTGPSKHFGHYPASGGKR